MVTLLKGRLFEPATGNMPRASLERRPFFMQHRRPNIAYYLDNNTRLIDRTRLIRKPVRQIIQIPAAACPHNNGKRPRHKALVIHIFFIYLCRNGKQSTKGFIR
jgi:hypothetical protein